MIASSVTKWNLFSYYDDSPPDQNDDGGDDGDKKHDRPEGAQRDDSTNVKTWSSPAPGAHRAFRPAAAVYGLRQDYPRCLLRAYVVVTADYLCTGILYSYTIKTNQLVSCATWEPNFRVPDKFRKPGNLQIYSLHLRIDRAYMLRTLSMETVLNNHLLGYLEIKFIFSVCFSP